MTTLFQIAVINAVTVLPLALLAFVVGRLSRRPALTHVVWVLVLLKLVTPPLFNLPVTIQMPVAYVPTAEATSRGFDMQVLPAVTEHAFEPVPKSVAGMSATIHSETPQVGIQSVALAPSIEAPPKTAMGVARTLPSVTGYWAHLPTLSSILLSCWLAGVAAWVILQIACLIRFQRGVIRDGYAPAELQAETNRLAMKLGLRQVPRVLVVDATVSPMLWGCGSRARLLFPAALAERLDDEARATLLTHELAHFRRGDQWVRLLELIATGLFWWHPVVWWARRQIEEAEEECCDAWVISEFPKTPRQYAEALLDTIDFLCETRYTLPPIASGFGQSQFLRRRLIMIMRGTAPKTLSHRCRCVVALVTALLLPLQPFVFGSASIANLRLDSLRPSAVDAIAVSAMEVPDTANTGSQSEITPAPTAAVIDRTPPSTRSRHSGEKTWSASVSPDGRFVIRTTTARRVVLTDLRNDSETDLSDQRIAAVAFAPTGKWFAAAGTDGRISIWDSAEGTLLQTLLTHTDVLRSVAVSPQGEFVAVGGRDGTALLIERATGQPVSVGSYSSAVNCVRFSPDGSQLAVAVGDWMSNRSGEVVLQDVATGRTEATLACRTSPGALAFASNDELIVGHWDGYAQLWNLVTQKVIGSATANKNIVSAAAFSPNNPVLLEVTFAATEPNAIEEPLPAPGLRALFEALVKPEK